jgi:hypothetical protein
MHWKYNFDLFSFLKFENQSSCSKVEGQFWQQLCFKLAAVGARDHHRFLADIS